MGKIQSGYITIFSSLVMIHSPFSAADNNTRNEFARDMQSYIFIPFIVL